jgi:hypothetical protein
MFSSRRRPRSTYANVVSSLALFVALGGGAVAATVGFVGSNGTVRICVGKHGAATIAKAGKKCPKATTAVVLNQVGRAGVNGAQGLPGAPGRDGSNGTPGTDLTVSSTLAPGRTESGIFAANANVEGGYGSTAIEFRPLLATGVAEGNLHYIPQKAADPSCPGPGEAARGHLCLYEGVNSGMVFLGFYSPKASTSHNADATGVVAFFTDSGGIQKHVRGTWSVTAP